MAGNGWGEDRKLVEFRLDKLEERVERGFSQLTEEVRKLREESIKSRAAATTRRNLFLAIAGLLGGAMGTAATALAKWWGG